MGHCVTFFFGNSALAWLLFVLSFDFFFSQACSSEKIVNEIIYEQCAFALPLKTHKIELNSENKIRSRQELRDAKWVKVFILIAFCFTVCFCFSFCFR